MRVINKERLSKFIQYLKVLDDFHVSYLVPMLGLIEGFSNSLSSRMLFVLKFSYDLSLLRVVFLFLLFPEHKVNRLARCLYIL